MSKELSENLSQYLTHNDRFFIYKEGIFYRTYDSLNETFPRSLKIIDSDNRTTSIINNYIETTMFNTFDIHGICSGFPNYLKTLSIKEKYPFIEDLACLELKAASSFHNDTIDFLSIEELVKLFQLPEDKICLNLQKSVCFFESCWPIVQLCNDIDNCSDSIMLKYEKKDSNFLFIIYLLDENVKVEPLRNDEFLFLTSLKKKSIIKKVM